MTYIHNHIKVNGNKSGLFGYLLLLTILFILIEISLFIQNSEIYLSDFKSVADSLHIPGKVVPGIMLFVLIQGGLHLLFTIFVWALARLIGMALQCSWKTTEKIGFSLWGICIAFVVFANQLAFPNSKFANLSGFIFPDKLAEIFFVISAIILSLTTLLAIYGLIFKIFKKRLFKVIVILFSLTFISVYLQHKTLSDPLVGDGATTDKPNIILIGIDSLRPDFLGYFGYEKHTPHLDNFLSHSTVFADAFTPIARTFPAWVSILTGEYPKHHGIRFSLSKTDHFAWEKTLPNILRAHGYETVYATDETRFSNIDQAYGFDHVVIPPMGFNDFVLGTLNDFPLSNLLVNSAVGHRLFPESYGNRPALITYNPNTFLTLLKPALSQSRNKPLFLTIHFCLPHYPYIWGTQKIYEKSLRNYQAAIQRMDVQFHDFLTLLQQNKLLEHSILVVLSDHGEALELDGDRATEADLFIAGKNNKKNVIPVFYPKSYTNELVNQSAGHGTDILSLTQYHTVLAFRTFGIERNRQAVLPGRVSLLDIKPTLLQLVHLPINKTNDGVSLLNQILGRQPVISGRSDFFMETDFSPQAMRTVHPETRELLLESVNFFQVDPLTTRLTVKKNMGKFIITSKQLANIRGEWILALYPQNPTSMTPILVNLKTGQWTNDLRTEFAMASPAIDMLEKLKQFYGSEITSVQNIPA